MIYKLSSKANSNANKYLLQGIRADAVDPSKAEAVKKYIATDANVPANLEYIKVTNGDGTTATLTKPVGTTTAAGVKSWLEGAIRDLGWFGLEGDSSAIGEYPDVVVTTGALTLYGQLVCTFYKFAGSETAFTVKSSRVAVSYYYVELGHFDNPKVLVDGTQRTTTIDITLGTTTGAQLETALETGIASDIPSKVYDTVATYDAEIAKFKIYFLAKPDREIKLETSSGVFTEAVYTKTVPDIV